MSELTPEIESLFEDQARRQAEAPASRTLVVEGAATVALAAAVLAMVAIFPEGGFASPAVIGTLVLAYALASFVRFDIGLGYTSPAQLVLIPMWFAVPPALLPAVVAAGLVVQRLVTLAVSERPAYVRRLILNAPDAWHAVGPALVLGYVGVADPTFSDWPLYAAAFAAQVVFDLAASALRTWADLGIKPGLQLRVGAWVFGVDAALTPIGLLVAVAMVQTPAALVCVLPLIGLIAVFARERDHRIRQALQLSGAYRGTAMLLGDVLEADDAYTGGEHTRGVVELALDVGAELGLDSQKLRDLEFGSLLHDIGKLRISNEIINKPGKLTEAEWEVIRRHPVDGQKMLSRVGGALERVGEIVRAHHERMDGGGYPDGLVGDEIPIEARIICVCDAYSAMTTTRSYRPAMRRADAVTELRRCADEQFDVNVVDALVNVIEREPAEAVPHLRLAA